jgi:AcrR family transcriptional regulator
LTPLVSDEYLKARRDQIIQAALGCFVEKGFARTTMQDIFAAAKLSPGAVYNYFRSKDDIVVAIAEESLSRNTQMIWAVVGGSSTPLEALIDFLFGVLAKNEGAVRGGGFDLELFSEAGRNPRLAEVLQRQSDALLGQIADVVREERERGGVRSDVEPRAVAQVLISLYYGVVIGRTADPDADVDAYAAAVKAAFHGGIAQGGEI